MIQEALYARTQAHAGLAALIGVRCYPRMLPAVPVYPACTYFMVSAERISAMGRDSGLVRGTLQVSSWGESYTSARAVREQVRAAFQRYRGTVSGVVIQDCFLDGESDMPEELVDGVVIHQLVSDLTLWYEET